MNVRINLLMMIILWMITRFIDDNNFMDDDNFIDDNNFMDDNKIY
jgi:hypothetical protein